MNIYSGIKQPAKDFETYFQGDTQIIKFYGEEFEKGEYTIPLKSLLAYEPIMVPEFNKEVTDLATGRLLEKDGSLTKVAKAMNEKDYLGEWSDIINTVTKGYAGNLSQIKSFALEVIGMEKDDIFSLDINTKIPGTEISDEALLKTMAAANKWAEDTMLIPKHIYEPPKPKDPKQLPKWMQDAKNLENQKTAWQDRLEQRVTTLGLGINKEGEVFTGTIKPFDAEGNIRPEFEKALSGIGYSIEKKINQDVDSDDPKAIAVEISMPGISGNKVRVFQDQIAQDFIYNLGLYTFGKNQMDWAGKYSGKFKGQKFN